MKHTLPALLICILTLASCEDQSASLGARTPLTCTDPETGIEMTKEACDVLANERKRRQEAEDRLDDQSDNPTETSTPTPNTPTPSAKPTPTRQPTQTATPQPTSHDGITDDGYFVHEELEMRFPLQEGYRVERLEITEEPSDYVDHYNAIGYFRVHTDDGDDFTIVVEQFAEGLDDEGFPKEVPLEGWYPNEWITLPRGVRAFEYDSGAHGYPLDAHITIYREDKIYYLREMNHEESVSNRLRAFARAFEITD